jgi:hypothetical protein
MRGGTSFDFLAPQDATSLSASRLRRYAQDERVEWGKAPVQPKRSRRAV